MYGLTDGILGRDLEDAQVILALSLASWWSPTQRLMLCIGLVELRD